MANQAVLPVRTMCRTPLSFTWIIVRQARLYHWSPQAVALVPSLAALAQSGDCDR